jgi:methylated-DNA-[protein]-cysteine S-methyltransferase
MLTCRSSFMETGIPAIGRLELLTAEQGLAAILFCGERRSRPSGSWRTRNVRSVETASPGEHDLYAHQLRDFLSGQRRNFTFPLHRTGTPFQRAVLDAVARVPYGARSSYRDVARAVGNPAACRAVGAANGANPLPLVIPCHRIVGSSQKLTGYGGGLDAKRWLLALESQALLARAS